ncbi:hypothetical protein Tsubulata_035755 [Turnera subulata]|uniref:Plant heme peroxidase family profile domain-containing protein n=1 Tax=Turnera subulata TaxID=218843 RepID=A0A9Q0J794_9ROSI|nr:hypothetical protein Tsubulata_035755 [Turnera subulata]
MYSTDKQLTKRKSKPGIARASGEDFVAGCDASILIESDDGDAERDAPTYWLSLRGMFLYWLAGMPSFAVELGRRDGLVSSKDRVAGKIPSPRFTITELLSSFAERNLTLADLVTLSGAHSLGSANCDKVTCRLRGVHGDHNFDDTPFQFDNLYYRKLVSGQGLLPSDQALVADPEAKALVFKFAAASDEFHAAFAASMRLLGRVGVKTGAQGEVRRVCSSSN